MDDAELKETLERLEDQQRKIIEQLSGSKTETTQKRDFWEKLGAISPIISGVAIALSALLCTYQYNQEQIKLQEAQTIEKFIPHLMGNDTSKRMAILAMKTLVNTDLAAKYAAMFPSEGTISALKTIAKNGDSRDKKIVSKTYQEIEANTKEDPDSVPSSLQTSANTSPDPEPAVQSEQPATVQPAADVDTASDATQPSHVQTKDHAAPNKEHTVAPHPADDKESRDDTQQKRDMEARQPQLERIRSSAFKEEVPSL